MDKNFLASETLAGKRTWIEISRSAARNNFRIFRILAGKNTELWPVVKSNAYGHGIFIFSGLMQEFGADGLCVDSALEAFALRRRGINLPLLVLGPTLPILYEEALAEKIVITISNKDALLALSISAHKPKFHLKFDTGMHRQGFMSEEAEWVVDFLKSHSVLSKKLRGVYTHFAFADTAGIKHTQKQLHDFLEIKKSLSKAGFTGIKYHISNTGGTMLNKKYHLDLIRPGIGMYGIYPSPGLKKKYARLNLRPVLSWKTRISETKEVPAGTGIGYDLTERVKRRSKIAVLPLGYWHGYPRSLSGRGMVLVAGRRVRVLGRVSMDLTAIDITGLSARPGDPVTLLGRSGKLEISADSIADLSGTIAYEFLTRLNPLIERVIIK